MPFNHNDHYHGVLLRELPVSCRRALDVGCGEGRFAAELARRGIEVDAIDADERVIASARERNAGAALPGRVRFERADVTRLEPRPETYDFIACLASIHHVPFETVRTLRASLTDDGVLVILGCYRETSFTDRALSLLAVPVNAAYRAAAFLRERRSAPASPSASAAPVTSPSMSLAEIRRACGTHLPGSRIRRLLFWRYLLVFRNDATAGATA